MVIWPESNDCTRISQAHPVCCVRMLSEYSTPTRKHMSNESPNANSPSKLVQPRIGESDLIWTIWLTYGAFYFCRTNISVALPGIEEELGYSKITMGAVLLSLKIAYGVGQLVNGQLAEQFRPRVLLAIGMFASAALNIVFGFGTALYFFLFVWACNGYCQSLGWTPCMRVIGNWIPVLRRGKAIGIIGTGYQVTAAATFVVSGLAASMLGWRGVFFVPPVILAGAGVIMLLFLRESPSSDDNQALRGADTSTPRRTFSENLILTVSNPALWLLALSLGMLNACRYGFLDWGVTHLVTIEQERLAATDSLATVSVLKSAVKYAVLPVGGIAGSFLAGWATDRFFGSRRAPMIVILLVCLGCITLAYDTVARTSFAGTMLLLLFVGFTVYGPQVLLVGTAPADLARGDTAAAAAGFVNFMGYFGAAVMGDLLTGYLVDNYGWQCAIFAWAGWAFAAAVLAAMLWNAGGSRQDSTNGNVDGE